MFFSKDFLLLLSVIYFVHSTPVINPSVCSQEPSILPTCEYSELIADFYVNIWSTSSSSYFTTCQHHVTEETIQPSEDPICTSLANTTLVDFLTCNNYTGDSAFCLSNNCTNFNPECYCGYYSRTERNFCNLSFFTENLEPITKLFTLQAGYQVFQILNILDFQYDLVNIHDLYIKNRKNGFNLVLPNYSNYRVLIHTPLQTIHFNFTGNILNFNFPESMQSRSFPYMFKLFNSNDNLIFSTLSETVTENFCNDPDCYMCKRAFENFNCLDSLHKFVLIFSLLVFFILVVLFLFLLGFLIFKLKCLLMRMKFFNKNKNLAYSGFNVAEQSELNRNKLSVIKKTYYKIPFIKKTVSTTAEIQYFVDLFKNTSFFTPGMNSVQLNSINFIKFLTSQKVVFKGNSQFLATFFMISMILMQVLAQCDIGGVSTATVNLCTTNNANSETCTLTLSVTATLDKILNTFCSQITDSNGNVIGTLRIGYMGASYDIYYNLEYFTSSWDPVTQSNFRCYQAPGSSCTSDLCLSPDRTAYGNLDDPNLAITYGATTCARVSPSTLSCFLPTYGCLFSGWGVLPNPNTLTGVFRQTATSPMNIELFYEIIVFDVRESGFITTTVGEPLELSLFEIQLDSAPPSDPDPELSLISFPSAKTKSVINPPGVYETEKIGDIQSQNPTSFTDPHYFNTIVTNPSSILISHNIQSHSANYVFHNSGLQHQQNTDYKLPIYLNHVHYETIFNDDTVSGFQYVKANMSDPPGITFTILGAFPITRTIESCTFDVEILSVEGCCSCTTGAYFIYSITYISQTFCNVYFTSNDVEIETVVNNQLDRLYFHTSDCQQDVHIRANSGDFHQDLSVSISLEKPVLNTFSDGVTTIQDITSEIYEEPGIDKGIKSFFSNKFNTHNVLHWAILIFIILVSTCLLLFCLWFLVQCFLAIILKTIRKNN